MENYISRRKHERKPREGYAQTLQLSLIPAAKISMVIMFFMSIGLIFCLSESEMGKILHGTLALGAIAISIRHFIEFRRLKGQLNELLKDHPEFKI